MKNQSESNTLVEDDYGNPETDEPTGVFKQCCFFGFWTLTQINFFA